MKTIVRICILVLLAVSSSCSDVLDIAPDGRLTMDQVFQDPDLTAAYFSNCYNNIPKKSRRYFWFSNVPVALSDEAFDCDSQSAKSAYQGSISASNNILDTELIGSMDARFWEKYWTQIRAINVFLKHLPTAALHKETDRDRWKGEAFVLRAFFYLQLVKWYGQVPISTEEYPLTETYTKVKKAPFNELFDFIISDCDSALQSKYMPWRIVDEAEKLRMTKAIACAIKSQAALYKASKLYCGDQNYWKEAYDINQDCFNQLKQHGYELYTKMQTSNYNCAYAEYFVQNGSFSTNPVDKETIWQSDFGEESMAYVWGTPLQGNYRCGTCPSQNLVDAYDMLATGKPIYHLDKPYLDDQGLQVNVDNTSGYNASKPYSGRDPRMDATVLHDGSSIYLAGKKVAVQTFTGGNCEMQSGSTRYSETGYYPFKGEYWNSGDGVAIQDGRWKYYRLGEIYLNYAEAAAEVGTPESIQKAMELVNTIRHRAGFDPSVDVSAPDKATAILIVRHERQVELAYEEHRYFDMRRWTSANEDLTNEKFTVGMKITKKGLGRVYERFVINSKDGVTPTKLSYLAKWHFWPISATEASTMESKTGDNWQNEGW